MTKEQAIKKYNLKRYNGKNNFTYFELWQSTLEDEEKTTFCNLDNQMSVDLQDSNIFFLTIEKVYKNKFVWDRYQQIYKQKRTIKCIEIKEAV